MRIELSHKANEVDDINADLMNNEEIILIKNRLDALERKFKNIEEPND